MAEVRVAREIRPPEPPPEASQLGFVVWLRKNLFNSPFNSVLTVIGLVGVFFGARSGLAFLLADERRWSVIPPNATNYAVEAYPRDSLERIWISVAIVAVLAGLSTSIWRPTGKTSWGKVVAGLRGFGAAALVLGFLTPGGFGPRNLIMIVGAAMIIATAVALRRLRERAKVETIPTLAVLSAAIVVVLAVIWAMPIASSTQIPWTVMLVTGVVAYLLGRLVVARSSLRVLKTAVVAAWVLSLPVIYMTVQRGPIIPWDRVGSWLPGIAAVTIIGLGAIRLVTRLDRERAALVNAALLAASIGVWFVSIPMIVRFLMIAATVFSLAAPTFAASSRGARNFSIGWVAIVLFITYFVTMSLTSRGLETRVELLGGMNVTFLLAIGGMLLSFPLGIMLALGRTSTMPVFRLMSTGYIEVVRGVPLITVLFFGDKVVPRFLPPGLDFEGVVKAVMVIALFSAAYLAENVRGGLQSVSSGQREAARALGMTTGQMTMLITLPQALRAVIPALVGQVISLFKDTSLVAIIGLADFFRVARDIVPNQPVSLGSVIENLVLAAVVYWVFTFSFSRASLRLERRLGVGTR